MLALADRLARSLSERHANRQTFTSIFDDILPEGGEPGVGLAYEVQDRYVAGLCALGAKPAGYKIGLTTKRMQQMCGVDEPISGIVLNTRILRSPANVRMTDYVRLGIESEMAVRIAPGVSERRGRLEALPLAELIDQVCAGFELVEDSGADYKRLSAASIIADNSWNAGLVFGPPSSIADFTNLRGRRGVLRRNGEEVNEGSSDEVLGDPITAVVWLAKHLERRGGELAPGQWVSTGAIVPTRFVGLGDNYQFEIDGLEPVDLRIS